MSDSPGVYREEFFKRMFGKSSIERIQELEQENAFLRAEKDELIKQSLAFSIFIRLCLSGGKTLEPLVGLVLRQNNTDPNTDFFELVDASPSDFWYRGSPEKVVEQSVSLIELVQKVTGALNDALGQVKNRTT